jgi:hypothetical protein
LPDTLRMNFSPSARCNNACRNPGIRRSWSRLG